MTKKLQLVILFVVLTLLVGCSSSDHYPDTASKEAAAPTAAPTKTKLVSDETTKPEKQASNRKIIYHAQMSLNTDSIDHAANKVEDLLAQAGGYIASSTRSGSTGTKREATWSLRVPSDRYQAFIKSISSIGELDKLDETSQDVTSDYFDSYARLKNKRVEEERLLDKLKRKEGNLNEILTLEHELARVREEIEVIQGRLAVLQQQTSYSNVDLKITEVQNFHAAGPPSFGSELGRTLTNSTNVFLDSGKAVLLLFATILPWSLPLLLIGLAIRKYRPKMHP